MDEEASKKKGWHAVQYESNQRSGKDAEEERGETGEIMRIEQVEERTGKREKSVDPGQTGKQTQSAWR